MSNSALAARSLVEAFMYLRVTPCPVCGSGELTTDPDIPNTETAHVRVVATCRNCGNNSAFEFELPSASKLPAGKIDPISSHAPISETPGRSRLIDSVQWVTLAQLMLDDADGTPDAGEARWRRMRAGKCIDEALRFYGADNELPNAYDLFTDVSRTALREHPQRYARSRLKGIQEKLPVAGAVGQSKPAREQDKPWWKFW